MLINQAGKRLTFNTEILKEQYKFCGILYKSRYEELSLSPNYLSTIHLPVWEDVERDSLDDPIVIEEIIEATRQ